MSTGEDTLSDSYKRPAGAYAVYCGVDVGKNEHHACALDPDGNRLHDKALPNDEAALVRVLTELAGHGRVLVVVDQPAAIGALGIAVARSLGAGELFSRFAGHFEAAWDVSAPRPAAVALPGDLPSTVAAR